MHRGVYVDDNLQVQVRAGLALADDQAIVPGRLRPVDPAEGVSSDVRPDPEEVSRVPGPVLEDEPLAGPVAGGGLGDVPQREGPGPDEEAPGGGQGPLRLPESEREPGAQGGRADRIFSPDGRDIRELELGRPPARDDGEVDDRPSPFPLVPPPEPESPGAEGEVVRQDEPGPGPLAFDRPAVLEVQMPADRQQAELRPDHPQADHRANANEQQERPCVDEPPAKRRRNGRHEQASQRIPPGEVGVDEREVIGLDQQMPDPQQPALQGRTAGRRLISRLGLRLPIIDPGHSGRPLVEP